jgi:hypothetical protein
MAVPAPSPMNERTQAERRRANDLTRLVQRRDPEPTRPAAVTKAEQ